MRQVSLLLTLPLLFTAVAASLYWGWQIVWQAAPWSSQFSLHPANIEIVTESPWVDRNAILQQVVHEASLDDQLSLLDPGLNERLSLAIKDHPWVESVLKIEKFQPPRVVVTLRYRQPVALVVGKVTGLEGTEHTSPSGIVDRHGIRLPLDESLMSSSAVQSLPRIEGVPFRPPEPGELWKDGRVRGGARMAAALCDEWRRFSLRSILPSGQPIVGSSETYTFELVTKGGKLIPWGPEYLGSDRDRIGSKEPTANEKADRLRGYVRKHSIDLDGTRIEPLETRAAEESSDR